MVFLPKRLIAFGIILSLVLGIVLISGCTSEAKQLRLYAGAGMKKPMDAVIAQYEAEKGVNITPNYGPSGGLYTQIHEGQPCDIYFSADQIYLDKLQNESLLTEAKGFLRENVVLVVSKSGEAKGIKSASDLNKNDLVVVVADPSAPVGAYSQKVLESLGLISNVSRNIRARPTTVNQVALMVTNDEADAGFIYSSTAKLYNLTYKERYGNDLSGDIVFGIGIIKGGNEALAKDFMNYAIAHSDEFTQYGWEKYA